MGTILGLVSMIGGAIKGIFPAIGAWLVGRSSGKAAERAAQTERRIDEIKEARDVENRLSGADDSERRRLRDKWTER